MGKPKINKASNTVVQTLLNETNSASLRKIDITQAADGGSFIFLHGRKHASAEDFSDLLKTKLNNIDFVSKTTVDDTPIVIARTNNSAQTIIKNWQENTGQTFTPQKTEKIKKKADLIKMRGTIGNIGQVFMIASGFLDGENKGKFKVRKDNGELNKDGLAKVSSAAISLIGNGVNSAYGVQKNVDDTRLIFAKGLVNDSLAMGNNSETANLPSKYTSIIKRTKAEKPSWMKQNSIKVSNGIKFFGKLALMQASDKNLALSGKLSLFAKIVTLAGKDEDHHNLEKDQSLLTKTRRKSNAISGILEWIANVTLFAGSIFKVPNDAVKRKFTLYDFDAAKARPLHNIQWFQMLGALTIFGSLTAKSLAPFTKKTLDIEELSNHSTIALVESISDGKHTDELTRLTARMLQTRELPELKDQGFASVFTDIANRLEQHHGIAINAEKTQNNQLAKSADLEPEIEVESDTMANIERKTKASKIANSQRSKTLVERVASEAETTSIANHSI